MTTYRDRLLAGVHTDPGAAAAPEPQPEAEVAPEPEQDDEPQEEGEQVCDVCGQSFKNAQGLAVHKTRTHPEEAEA